MTTIAILGPGGVGGFLAAALARARDHAPEDAPALAREHPPEDAPAPTPEHDDVLVVAREDTTAFIAAHGLRVRSAVLGDFAVRVTATSRLSHPVDVLVVATKAVGLHEALERVESAPRLVVPLLNGFEHMELLRGRFGAAHVAAGTIRIEADRPEPGLIAQTSPAVRVDLAADDAGAAAGLPALAARLQAAGIPARVEAGESMILWSKLVRLVALAITTSAADAPIGVIRSDPHWRPRLVAVIDEAAAVAQAEGAAIDPADRLAELEAAPPGLGSSMQRDIAAGRPPELDAIAGAVLRAARRHSIDCPALAELAAIVATRAGLPGSPTHAEGASPRVPGAA